MDEVRERIGDPPSDAHQLGQRGQVDMAGKIVGQGRLRRRGPRSRSSASLKARTTGPRVARHQGFKHLDQIGPRPRSARACISPGRTSGT